MLEKMFKLKENNTTAKTEVIAGITTFMTMAYILAVNPNLLSQAGMDPTAVLIATCLASFIGTFAMALLANYPFALAPGMGLNAYFAFTVCGNMGYSWKVALMAVFFEGIIFIILSLFKFRETLVNKVPKNLKLGISAGIGLFITIVGLKGAGVIVSDAYYDGTAVQSSTLVTLGDLGSANVVLAIVGLLIVAALWHFKVKGSILIGIIVTYIFGIIAQLCGWYQGTSLIPDFSNYAIFAPVQNMATETLFKFDFTYVAQNVVNFAVIVFAFLFVDLFDTVGTLIGVAQQGNLLNEKGELPRVGKALMADAVGTCVGACLGTSTVTSYVESTTGVAEGGRTGLTAMTSGILFLLAIPFYPIFLAIPSFATAPALVFVGLLMLKNITQMDFESDIADTVGGFLAIIMMPFAYSIATGIMFGIVSWVILKIVTGKIKQIHPVMWVAAALFVVRIVTIVLHIAS